MSDELRIREVILCEAGCGRIACESGFRWKCERGIVGLSLEVDGEGATRLGTLWGFNAHCRPGRPDVLRTQEKPDMPDYMYWLLAPATIGLLGWIGFKIAEMFADWLASGGSPWQ